MRRLGNCVWKDNIVLKQLEDRENDKDKIH